MAHDAIECTIPVDNLHMYAEFRVSGQGLELIRRALSVRKRGSRACLGELERTLGPRLARRCRTPGHRDRGILRWCNQVKGVSLLSLEAPGLRSTDGETLNLMDVVSTDNAKSPAQLVQAHRLKALVAEAIDDLPYQEKVVISLYYYEELTMKEIGKVLDITESRVSQIHTKSILHLRNKLKLLLQDDLEEE